jgi:hypothetical protein
MHIVPNCLGRKYLQGSGRANYSKPLFNADLQKQMRTFNCRTAEDFSVRGLLNSYLLHSGFLLGLFFSPEDGG